MIAGPTRREVAVAGHRGDVGTARSGLDSPDAHVRAGALASLQRLGALDDQTLTSAVSDGDPAVRRRAAELAATHPDVDLLAALDDPDETVVEAAAWACGERAAADDAVITRLIELGRSADAPLVREAAVAALGALGDSRAVDVIVAAATTDKPAVRRRAVLALAPFESPAVEAALDHALSDRDWQVRQNAEDLRRAAR